MPTRLSSSSGCYMALAVSAEATLLQTGLEGARAALEGYRRRLAIIMGSACCAENQGDTLNPRGGRSGHPMEQQRQASYFI